MDGFFFYKILSFFCGGSSFLPPGELSKKKTRLLFFPGIYSWEKKGKKLVFFFLARLLPLSLLLFFCFKGFFRFFFFAFFRFSFFKPSAEFAAKKKKTKNNFFLSFFGGKGGGLFGQGQALGQFS